MMMMDEENQKVNGESPHEANSSSNGRLGNFLGDDDIHQQLAEKDDYLTLAAEAGQVLLEENQELKKHFDALQDEYLRKIESLQQDRYQLKKTLSEQDSKHDSCMQDLQSQVASLNGQLQSVKRSSRAIEYTTESTYESLAGQNNSLLQELENVKAYNKTLSRQVENLSSRMDQQQDVQITKVKAPEGGSSGTHVDPEIQGMKEMLKQLINQKDALEESVSGMIKDKLTSVPLKDENVSEKFSNLEDDLTTLREQMKVCQEDLYRTRKKNEKLEDQLEEYVMLQSVQGNANVSLLNELSESSIPEVDMNTNKDVLNSGLCEVYNKLSRLKKDLNSDPTELADTCNVSIDMVDIMVDDIFELVQQRLLCNDSIMDDSGVGSSAAESSDNMQSQQECDILKQQLHDLNRYVNTKLDELSNTKTELLSFQNNNCTMSDKVQELSISINAKDREIESLRREKEILMDSGDIDSKLKMALKDRAESFIKENEAIVKYETALSDMQKLNNQLVSVVKEKHELSEQLEMWQFDMASVIDKQVSKNLKTESPGKKNKAPPTQRRSFAAKLFPTRSSNK